MHVPASLYDPRLLNKIQPAGVVAQATGISTLLLNSLLGDGRIRRMMDNEAMNGKAAYTPTELLGDLDKGLWSELAAPTPTVDVYRRSLQRSFLNTLDAKVNGTGATTSDLRPVAKGELRNLARRIDLALPRTTDVPTRNHLLESRRDIENILNNKYKAPGVAAQSFSFADLFGIKDTVQGCFDPLSGLRSAEK